MINRLHKDIDRRIIRDILINPCRVFLLWNKPTLEASVKDYNRRLKIYNDTNKFPYEDLIKEAEEMMKEKKENEK